MPAKVKTAEIDKRIQSGSASMSAMHDRNRKIVERTAAVAGLRDVGKMHEIAFDIDTDLEDARKNEELMKENMAVLVQGLADVTDSFGGAFSQMSQSTTGEKILAFFSPRTAAAKQSERIRSADMSANLDTMIEKSNTIEKMLGDDLVLLMQDKQEISTRFSEIRTDAVAVVAEMAQVEAEIAELARRQAEVQAVLRDATGVDKTRAETETMEITSAYNERTGHLQTLTAVSQSHERYSSQFGNRLTALDTQIAAVNTLINKTRYDTQQRSLLYRALTQSLKTARSQDVGHRINSIGVETDAQAEAMMSQISQASGNHIADMMEGHRAYMERSAKIAQQNHIHQDQFQKRFSAITKDMEGRKLFLSEG
jgi:hypothetical protein